MDDNKWTLKTTYGGVSPEVELTFYRDLQNNLEVKEVIESLALASDDIRILMREIENNNPEYCNKLLEVQRQIIQLRLDLMRQFDGNIIY